MKSMDNRVARLETDTEWIRKILWVIIGLQITSLAGFRVFDALHLFPGFP